MIKVSVQPTVFSDLIKSMQIDNAPWTGPQGPFYQLQENIVPFGPQPTVLRIETDRIGEPIRVEVVQSQEVSSQDIRENSKTYTLVAASSVATIGVQLGRGRNQITVSVDGRDGEITYLTVRATTIVTLWEAFSRVLYQESIRIIDEQKRAVSSRLATRLLEPFISFQDLLPDIQSLQILATRLVARGLIHSVGTNVGVTDLIKAVSLTTPVYRRIDKDTDELYPALDPWVKSASQFGGQEAHVWLPNLGIASWLTFIKYIQNQPDLYNILSISEREVVIEYQGRQQRHRFDFDSFGTDFLQALAQSECFRSIIIIVTTDVNVTVPICAASYTWDLYITAPDLLGNCRDTLDQGIPLDSNCPFDADDVDPFTDGWVNLSLTGRFEQDHPFTHTFDTFVIPSTEYTGDLCGYESYYTQVVMNQKLEPEVDAMFEVTGAVQTAIGWTLESPDTTRWDITVDSVTQTLVATSGSTRTPDDWKVTKPDTSEAAFAITNAGEVQVVSPPPGGELLRDTIFIKADNGYVWHVTVNNANTIVLVQIFPVP